MAQVPRSNKKGRNPGIPGIRVGRGRQQLTCDKKVETTVGVTAVETVKVFIWPGQALLTQHRVSGLKKENRDI